MRIVLAPRSIIALVLGLVTIFNVPVRAEGEPRDPDATVYVRWRLNVAGIPSALTSTPGGVLAGTTNGLVWFLSTGGTVAWQRALPAGDPRPDIRGFAWAEDAIFVNTSSTVYRLDAATGDIEWQTRPWPELSMTAPPALSGDGLFVVSSAGDVRRLSPQTGDTIWEVGLDDITWADLLAKDGYLIALTGTGLVRKLNAEEGATLWQVRLPGSFESGTRPVVEGDNLFVAATPDHRGGVYQLSLSTGSTVATHRYSGDNRWGPPVLDDGALFVPNYGFIARFATDGSLGRLWVSGHLPPFKSGRTSFEPIYGPPLVGSRRLFVATRFAADGPSYAAVLDGSDGALLGYSALPGKVVSEAAWLGDDIVVGLASSEVVGLRGVTVVVAGSKVAWSDQSPVIRDGTTLVPFRDALTALGADIEWVDETRTVIARKASTTIVIRVGSREATVNGMVYPLERPAEIIGGRAFVPLRFLSEGLSYTVKWSQEELRIDITE